MSTDIPSNVFPGSVNLVVPYILSFLVSHDWEECVQHLSKDQVKLVEPDQSGTITLNAAAKTFTVQLPTLANDSMWNFERPGTQFADLNSAPGKLYTAKSAPLPSGDSQFWIQQYRNGAGLVGRTVVEFYTDNVITAVFKTDVDNFGATGTGSWVERK